MKALARLEGFIQDLVERPAWLLSTRRLHPLEMAAAITRALETAALPLVDRVLAPDVYILQLNPEDFAQFAGVQATLEQEFAGYIGRLAGERGVTLNIPPSVAIVEGRDVRSGTVRVLTRFTEDRSRPAAAARTIVAGRDGIAGPGFTEQVRPPPVRPSGDGGAAPALDLLGPDGAVVRRYPLRNQPVVIGRRASSDLALADAEVSRRHATIEFEPPHYYLRDLESTNGTLLNGRRVTGRQRLADGDLIEAGRSRLRFRRGG